MKYGTFDTFLRVISVLAILSAGLWLLLNGFGDDSPAPASAGPSPIPDIESVIRINDNTEPVRWEGILLYHSGVEEDTARDVKTRFTASGFKRLPFHFLIDSAGGIFATRNWREQLPCDQPVERYFVETHICICVLGNFSFPESTLGPGQFESLKDLARYLQEMKFNRIPKVNVIPAHAIQTTESPGECFPWKEFRRALK